MLTALKNFYRFIFFASFATSLYFSGKYFYILYYPGETFVNVSENSHLTKTKDDTNFFEKKDGINCNIAVSDEAEKNNQTNYVEIDKKKIISIIKEFIDKNPEYIKNAIKD